MIGKEEKDAVLRVIESGCLSGFQGNWSDNFYGGPEIKALESEWAEYFGVKHAIACNSATSGLWMACAAIGLEYDAVNPGDIERDEVIATPYSMTCSASMPLHFGANPVFADIEKDYFCLDPASVESKITERTKAIIVVDLFGQPYDADAINEIAERYGKKYGHKIYVIEDAAQAIGARYKGRYAGTLGDIGVYSLNRNKHIQCGEGGVVVTNDDDLADKLRLLMNHAEAVINDIEIKGSIITETQTDTERRYSMSTPNSTYFNLVGMNLRMTELSAAVAREQLKKFDGILRAYQTEALRFPVKERPCCHSAFYRYAWLENEWRDFAINADRYNVKQHYITPLYRMPLFVQLGYPDGLCPVCEEVEKNIVLAWLKNEP
jgi:dTDP-4-amino-4,6-dideoxygalactose transaminase